MSLDPRGLVRAAPGYCGKLRSNFLGTEFTALDMDVSKPVYPVRGRTAYCCKSNLILFSCRRLPRKCLFPHCQLRIPRMLSNQRH